MARAKRRAASSVSISAMRLVYLSRSWAVKSLSRGSLRDRLAPRGLEHAFEHTHPLVRRERLLDVRHGPALDALPHEHVGGVTRHEHDRQSRTLLAQALGELAAVERRHHDVRQHRVDAHPRMTGELERVLRAGGDAHG